MKTKQTNGNRKMQAVSRMPFAVIAALAIVAVCPQAFSAKLYKTLDMGGNAITNVPTPVNPDHVANKAYVDAQQLLANEMVLIPAGDFQMGDAMDGEADALPLHTSFITSFYMGKTEVTYAQWTKVIGWANSHGYDLSAGSGKAGIYPVHSVTWYDAVKWCNARSEMQGLTQCYYTTAAQTVVYRTGNVAVQNDCVKWTANGYRLPTEAEWEKAARGGAVSMRFPWDDASTIANSRANYSGAPGTYAYDLGPAGYNPLFTAGGMPYTSPVAYFASNGYGLYDMAGNVWEWCWDWYSSTYYGSSPASDPRGPASGSSRVIRGGSWYSLAYLCRSALRNNYIPDNTNGTLGFRVLLPAGQ